MCRGSNPRSFFIPRVGSIPLLPIKAKLLPSITITHKRTTAAAVAGKTIVAGAGKLKTDDSADFVEEVLI